MKVEFLIENIEQFLPAISRILPIHSQIPVLSNLLIEAKTDGFYISATNLELGIKIKIPAKVEEEGATTVPGKQFIEALSAFPKEKITAYTEKEKLIITARGSRVAFQTIQKEEFPTIYEQMGDKIHTFKKNDLNDIFSKLIFAVSVDDSRPELTGILISQKKNEIDFVATDGFRLSIKRKKGNRIFEEEEFVILPSRIITEAMALKNDEVSLYLYKKANQAIFETESVVLIGSVINGEFPNYERVIPTVGKTTVVVDKEEFLQKIKISSIFARDAANIIKIKTEKGKVKIFASSSGVGEGEVVLDGKQEGEDNEIAFNVKFLNDVLKNSGGKTIIMQLTSPIEPALFKNEEDPEFTHIIMPVRVQD